VLESGGRGSGGVTRDHGERAIWAFSRLSGLQLSYFARGLDAQAWKHDTLVLGTDDAPIWLSVRHVWRCMRL
jgi:hypothetical protein